jgi:uncharacterized protein (DUF1697 family)
MSTWIALFRGINVGGRNILPMKELVRDLEALELEDVRTYIQSGNAVFRSSGEAAADLGARIAAKVEERHGFRPHVLVLSAGQLRDAIESNPFPEAEGEPKTLHLSFLASPAEAPDVASLNELRSPSERFHLTDTVFYLHAPDGIGRSKLAAKVEKLLGVAATARNWRTVRKLRQMAGAA